MLDVFASAARFLVFAGTLVMFGGAAFFCYATRSPMPADSADAHDWRDLLVKAAAACALAASLLSLIAESMLVSVDAPDGFGVGSVWAVIAGTRFGRIGALRCAVLVTTLAWMAASSRRSAKAWAPIALLGACLTASFAWTGHGTLGSGVPGRIHLGGDVLHLLSAGLWIGALISLCVLANRAFRHPTRNTTPDLAFGLDRFSAIGVLLVAVLLLSGITNSWYLLAPTSWRDLGRSLYGRLILAKVVLLSVMIVMAAINRWRLAPQIRRVEGADPSGVGALRALRATLVTEMTAAFLTLGVVAYLGTLEPPSEPA